MGTFEVTVAVGDGEGSEFEQVVALADTGATFTTVPSSLLRRLGVAPTEKIRFRLADNRVVEREVGETTMRVEGRLVRTAVVFGDDAAPPLLGAYTLERALLAVDPVRKRLIPTEALLMAAPRLPAGAKRRIGVTRGEGGAHENSRNSAFD